MLCKQVLRVATGRKSNWFLIWRVCWQSRERERETQQRLRSDVMQQLQRVKQHLIQIAKGIVLTLTFSCELRVGLSNGKERRQRLNNNYWDLSCSNTSSTGSEPRISQFLPKGSKRQQCLSRLDRKLPFLFIAALQRYRYREWVALCFTITACFQTTGAKWVMYFFFNGASSPDWEINKLYLKHQASQQ